MDYLPVFYHTPALKDTLTLQRWCHNESEI